jgi:hypothetical protein
MLKTRFGYFARQSLRDLDGFRDRSAFRHKAGHVGAGRNEAAFFQRFKMKPDGYLVHICVFYHNESLAPTTGGVPRSRQSNNLCRVECRRR